MIYLFLLYLYGQGDASNQIQQANADTVKRYDYIGPTGLKCSAGVARNWNNPAGTFKQSMADPAYPCTPGFFCPPNAVQPVYVCPGFYSKTPDTIAECPENYYCPRGSVEPLPCLYLAICPTGTTKPQRFVVIALGFIILMVLLTGFSIKKKFDIQTAIKNRIQIDHIKRDRMSIIQMSSNELTIDIQFEDLTYSLADGTPILSNISGFLQSGKMVAIMGPSGSGKTTLFSILTGKLKRTKGRFLLNNSTQELTEYRKVMGYVPQDDIMIKELNVDHILTHSALTRLPKKMSFGEKRLKVLEVIKYLGLKQVINSQIGDEKVRGISGGQRKRVNIGMEIVADPSILFLDEPTSGLDSSSALELTLLLKNLAKEKLLTISAIIHAPNPSVFYQFDDVLFLGLNGRVVYFGPTKGVYSYFTSLGFVMQLDNPADFAIDVISGKIPCQSNPDFLPSDLSVYWDNYQRGMKVEEFKTLSRRETIQRESKTLTQQLQTTCLQIYTDYKEWCLDVYDDLKSDFNLLHNSKPIRETPNIVHQYYLLLKRAGIQLFKSPSLFLFDLFIHFTAGIIVSIAIQDFNYIGKLPPRTCDITIDGSPVNVMCKSPTDLISNSGMLMIFGILFSGQAAAVPTFSHEKTVYWRDRSSGMPALPYYLAKITVDIPRIILAAIFYTLAFLVFVDYRSSIYWIFFLVVCTYFTAFHMGYFLSIILPKESVLLASAASSLFWGFLLSGVYPDYSIVLSSFGGLRGLWELSGPRFGVELYYILEVGARPWQELWDEDWSHGYSRDNFRSGVGSLIGIGIMWGCLSFMALKLAKRQKQR
eukprot:NODE_397_length_9427_cov_0.309605.p1 type:complete len:818 gc:universal NODE_397_length_9427_cov_0.309605:6531-8984(+)